jgi:hypothetical protein
LLVVITVIALLIGILLPALSKAREAAIRITGGSQHHQNAIAIHSYAADNNGYAPAGINQDWTVGSKYLAGHIIWGAQPDGARNIAIGMGRLYAKGKDADPGTDFGQFGDYAPIDLAYDPGELTKKGGSEHEVQYYIRDLAFGAYSGWPPVVRNPPDLWDGRVPAHLWELGPWWDITQPNAYMHNSYAYRGPDFSVWDGVPTNPGPPAPPAVGNWHLDQRLSNCIVDGRWAQQFVMADYPGWPKTMWPGEINQEAFHPGGGNVTRGDGSSIFLQSERYERCHYNYHPSSDAAWKAEFCWDLPSNGPLEAHHAIYQSLLFDRLDAEDDNHLPFIAPPDPGP